VRNLDFSSWQALLPTLLGLAVITLVGVGIRLLAMQTIQQRRERENRQINERLRTLIAAYKTLGGSFTGELAVDPTHLGDLKRGAVEAMDGEMEGPAVGVHPGSDRRRRIRDAVEAALSDVIRARPLQKAQRTATATAQGKAAAVRVVALAVPALARESARMRRPSGTSRCTGGSSHRESAGEIHARCGPSIPFRDRAGHAPWRRSIRASPRQAAARPGYALR
jgi:hypothetical protein